MKIKFLIASFAAVSAALLFLLPSSCSKTEQADIAVSAKNFSAIIVQENTRTALTSTYNVHWESSDRISINGAIYSASPKTDAAMADFTYISGKRPDSPYSAIYPASLYVTDHFEFPAVQTYSSDGFNAPMYAEGSSESLAFKNICGVICIALKGVDKVRSIKVSANEPICGTFTMADPTTVNLTGNGKNITLDCGADGVQLNVATATRFYIYLPPKASYSAGMKFTVTTVEGVNDLEKTTAVPVIISRSNLYTFNWTLGSVTPIEVVSLPGKFSVSNDNGATVKKIRFSQGNLRYIPASDNKWSFFDNQFDICCTNSYSGHHSDTLSLFTWGYNAIKSCLTDGNTDDNVSRISGNLAITEDWGYIFGGALSSWRTLTSNEWIWLINNRENADSKMGYATVGGVCGIILLPDTFADPMKNNGNGNFRPKPATGWNQNIYAKGDDWNAMEAAGAVFLPAAGHRGSYSIYTVNETGNYWSSTTCYSTSANSISFNSVETNATDSEYRSLGCSVRLVTEASE